MSYVYIIGIWPNCIEMRRVTKSRTRGLRQGNVGNCGGRPSNAFREKAKECVEHWLGVCAEMVEELRAEAETFEQKSKVLASAIKLTELYGRFSGVEKVENFGEIVPPVVVNFGGMSLSERQDLLAHLESDKPAAAYCGGT